MNIRQKLRFSFLSLLFAGTLLGAALVGVAVENVRRIEQIVNVYDVLQLKSLKVRFDMILMSDGMRGYMLNPEDPSEHTRKLEADRDFPESGGDEGPRSSPIDCAVCTWRSTTMPSCARARRAG
jgi:hypothetical protein